MASDLHDIGGFIRALRASGLYARVPAYNDVWRAAAEGRIPARREKRVWKLDWADRDTIAAALGLEPVRTPAPRPKPRPPAGPALPPAA